MKDVESRFRATNSLYSGAQDQISEDHARYCVQPGCCAFTIGQGDDKIEKWPVLIFLMQISTLINEHR